MPTRTELAEDLISGWLFAGGFALLSTLPLLGLGVLSLIQTLAGTPEAFGLGSWLITVLVVWGSYFVAGTLGGIVYWLTRPLRPGLVGYIASGALLGPAIYCSVGWTLALVWNPVGRLFFGRDGSTQAQFLAAMPLLALLFAGVGIGAGIYFWTQDH